MKLINKEQILDGIFKNEIHEYWDLGNGSIVIVHDCGKDIVTVFLPENNNIVKLSPAERFVEDEKFACKIQKNIQTIKIGYGIDVVYIDCHKDQLKDVLTTIEQHIHNQH
jgi:hypothetical protein